MNTLGSYKQLYCSQKLQSFFRRKEDFSFLLAAGTETGKIGSSGSIGSFPIIQRRKRGQKGEEEIIFKEPDFVFTNRILQIVSWFSIIYAGMKKTFPKIQTTSVNLYLLRTNQILNFSNEDLR